MRRASSPADLASEPLDRYWLGKAQIVWCKSARMCGSLTWGVPDQQDIQELTQALELARHPALAGGFRVFMDTSSIERVDWQPFSLLATYVRERLPEWSVRIQQQAVVVPEGPAGPLLAGMVPMLGMTYPMKFFSDVTAATDWLGWRGDAEASAALEEVQRLGAEARSITPIVHRLRAWLESALVGPSLDSAASALGVSSRSLQRELQRASTSFTGEVQAARVRVACALLSEGDEKIEVIARTVGCQSGSQLSTLFRKLVGDTPARYRERLSEARSAKR